uniref:Uncharacterized protein n=1 Tax=Phlebotomus papatasi TaxID=29031 RepID=A0A1B0DHF0_PHLPP
MVRNYHVTVFQDQTESAAILKIKESIGPMNPRMNPPRGPGMGPMGPGSYGPTGIRGPPPPNSTLGGPGGPGLPPGMGIAGGRPQWQPNTSTTMSYSSSSPGTYGGPPGSGPPGPGTPIMPSPQDSSNSGGENMYTLMKPVPSGNMGGVSVRVASCEAAG